MASLLQWGISLLAPLLAVAQLPLSAECSISIEKPQPSEVGDYVMFEGTGRIPPDAQFWLVLRWPGSGGYLPRAHGPIPVDSDGWEARVKFEDKYVDDGDRVVVSAVVVDRAIGAEMLKWVKADESAPRPQRLERVRLGETARLPPLVEGCTELDEVVLMRVGGQPE